MNKQGPGKIGWTDFTWNPIKGMCPVGCWYCYARRMYQRFKWLNVATIPDGSTIPGMLDINTLREPEKLKEPSKIFVCSTYEIFYHKKSKIRDAIFEEIEKFPQHTFQILTKMPENIDRDMPDNVWLGTSITDPIPEHSRAYDLFDHAAKVRFVSLEPLLGLYTHSVIPIEYLDWIIVGRMTGHGRKHDPPREWIERIVDDCREFGTPVFLKHNLKDIWGGELIQEFPK